MQAFTSVNCPLTGDEAKTLFTNLRSKYTRDKKNIDGKKVSGAGTDEVTQAVKEASEIYPFMKWLEPYSLVQYPRGFILELIALTYVNFLVLMQQV